MKLHLTTIVICSIFSFLADGKDDCSSYPPDDDTYLIIHDRDANNLPVQKSTRFYGYCKHGYHGKGSSNEFYSKLYCDKDEYKIDGSRTCRDMKDEGENSLCQWDDECTKKTPGSKCIVHNKNNLSKKSNCVCVDLSTHNEAFCVEDNGRKACLYDGKAYLEHKDPYRNHCYCTQIMTQCLKSINCDFFPSFEASIMMMDEKNTQLPIISESQSYGFCKSGYVGSKSNTFYSKIKCRNADYFEYDKCRPIQNVRGNEICQWDEECELHNSESKCRIENNKDLSKEKKCICDDMTVMDGVYCVHINGTTACLYTDGDPYIKHTDSNNNTCFCEELCTKCTGGGSNSGGTGDGSNSGGSGDGSNTGGTGDGSNSVGTGDGSNIGGTGDGSSAGGDEITPPDGMTVNSMEVFTEVKPPFSSDDIVYGVCRRNWTNSLNNTAVFMSTYDEGTSSWAFTSCQEVETSLSPGESCVWHSECLNFKCILNNEDELFENRGHNLSISRDNCMYIKDFSDLADVLSCNKENSICLDLDMLEFKYIYQMSNYWWICDSVQTTCSVHVPLEGMDMNSLELLSEVYPPYSSNDIVYGVCSKNYVNTLNYTVEFTSQFDEDSSSWTSTSCEHVETFLFPGEKCIWDLECFTLNCTLDNEDELFANKGKNKNISNDNCAYTKNFNALSDKFSCNDEYSICLDLETLEYKYIYHMVGYYWICDSIQTTCSKFVPPEGIADYSLEFLTEVYPPYSSNNTMHGVCRRNWIIVNTTVNFTTTFEERNSSWSFTSCEYVEPSLSPEEKCIWHSQCLNFECNLNNEDELFENMDKCMYTEEFNSLSDVLSCNIEESICLDLEKLEFKYIYHMFNYSWICDSIQTTCSTEATTPEPIPTSPPQTLLSDDAYPITTDYYIGDFHVLTQFVDNDNTEDHTFNITDGPLGFSKALIQDETKQQCVEQIAYQEDGDVCTSHPINCEEGLSFSIWVQMKLRDDIYTNFRMYQNDTKGIYNQYILSSGGDRDGSPGFAIYQRGPYIGALVSTGEAVWVVEITNPITSNDQWTNIGIRWEGYNVSGLEMFLDWELSGRMIYPEYVEENFDALVPSRLMFGCHKTQYDEEYWGYNSAVFDEFAMWTRRLKDDETKFFLGGRDLNLASISTDEFETLLNNVDLSNPDLMAMALDIASSLDFGDEPPTTTVAPSSTEPPIPGVEPEVTSTSAPAPTTTPVDTVKELKNFKTLRNIASKFTNVDNVPSVVEPAGFQVMTGVLKIASSIMSPKNIRNWKELEMDKDDSGAAGLVDRLNSYYSKALFNTRLDNTTSRKTSTTREIVKATDEILLQGSKITVEEFQESSSFAIPALNNPEVKKWDMGLDRVFVPTGIFQDERCTSRPIGVVSTIYQNFNLIASTKVNKNKIDSETQKTIDCRVRYVDINVSPGLASDGSVNPFAPICKPDPLLMKQNPIIVKLEHVDKLPSIRKSAMRKLKFHEEEKFTDIVERHCVIWNVNETRWEKEGCWMVESEIDFTVCHCEKFGMYAVMAEKLDPIEVLPEEEWLTYTKYVLYAISGLFLVFYCIIVVISSDLKEQFHLMSMNLSVAVLFGSLAIVFSDIQGIRDDRHKNVICGTLIHFFYNAAACWAACLGHASFKAITSGVIGGKLKAYCMIGWGLPLLLIGLPFTIFLHDLGKDPRCFISWENKVKLLFFAPQESLCFIGVFFGIVILCNLCTPAFRKKTLLDDYGTFSRGTAFVTFFIGVTWVFGYFAYMRMETEIPEIYAVFHILNSLTGVIIFCFVGIGSFRYRTVLAGQAKARKEKLLNYASGENAGSKPLRNDPLDNDNADAYSRTSSANSRNTEISSASSRLSERVAGRPPIRSASRPNSS